jgi:S-formylglutathione hydrolase
VIIDFENSFRTLNGRTWSSYDLFEESFSIQSEISLVFMEIDLCFQSVSAFAPICNPINCPWGQKGFSGYLGEDKSSWKQYDATELVSKLSPETAKSLNEILIDQGAEDTFLKQKQLLPENFLEKAAEVGAPVTYRLHAGYDHSYFFISSFVDDHIAHHAKFLQRN